MVTAETEEHVMQNEVAYIVHGEERLKSEVIRIRGNLAEMQVYENTRAVKVGEEVEFTNPFRWLLRVMLIIILIIGALLSATLLKYKGEMSLIEKARSVYEELLGEKAAEEPDSN